MGLEQPERLENEVGVFTQLGNQVDLKLQFTNSSGKTSALKDFLHPDKPTIIVPVYYRCPRLCGLVLDGVLTLINNLPLLLRNDYGVVVVSFNSVEVWSEANDTRQKFLPRLNTKNEQREEGLKFLVGEQVVGEQVVGGQGSSDKLMAQLGFKFLPDGKDFAHSAAVMILTPQGKISQYFTGISFPPWDVRLALVEASSGKIGTAVDHFLLYCFRFDPLKGKYTWAVVSMLRIGGALTLLGLGVVYFFFARRRLKSL